MPPVILRGMMGDLPQSLKDRLSKGAVIPFVGAGVSMAVRRSDGSQLFPSWRELLLRGADQVKKENPEGPEADLVRALIEVRDPDYLEAAKRLRSYLGPLWIDFLKAQLNPPHGDADPKSLELAQAIWGLGSRLLVTTNYDRVLRWACPEYSVRDLAEWDIEAPAELQKLLAEGQVPSPTVWHLHGKIGNAARLILTPDGYRLLYPPVGGESHYRAALSILRYLLAARSLLFIGFSLDDEHFGTELRAIADVFPDTTVPHFVLAHRSHEDRLSRQVPEHVRILTFEDFGESLLETVREMRTVARPPGFARRPAGLADEATRDVYLASVADDLIPVRERLRGELVELGVSVDEERIPPPADEEKHREAVTAALRRVRLAVHLLNGSPGAEIYDAEGNTTYQREQVRLGLEHARAQLVWVPPELEVAEVRDPPQRLLLEEFESGTRIERAYDLHRGPEINLARDIADKLSHLPAMGGEAPVTPTVLLDVNVKDQALASAPMGALLEHDVQPILNLLGDDPSHNLDLLRERLRTAGGLVVLHGQVSKDWVCSRLDVAARIAVNEIGPNRTFCVYLAPGDKSTEPYKKYQMVRVRLLDNRAGFDPKTLGPLIEDLGGARQSRRLRSEDPQSPDRRRSSVGGLPENPYVGLRPFESHEAILFFGRDEQAAELLERLHATRFLAVVGSSGCGKSSLIRAGLIPHLKAGFLVEERERWLEATFRPGGRPLDRLARALRETLSEEGESFNALDGESLHGGAGPLLEILTPALDAAATNLLLFVDQFEEVFRFGLRSKEPAKKKEAAELVALILALARQRQASIYVALTMRSDFLGDCDAYRGLPEALNRSQYLVPRLTRRQRRWAVEGPAKLYGRQIASRLVDRLLNDAGDEPDQLPVLQHALMRLWDKDKSACELNLDHYRDIGTIEKALSLHAEEALREIDDQMLAEKVFRALTEIDANNRQIRRPVTLADLVAETGGDRQGIIDVIQAFRRQDRSFLMPPKEQDLSRDTPIDISHESLIRQWERLQVWAETEAAAGNLYRRIEEAAQLEARRDGELLAGRDLERALEWRQETEPSPAWSKRYGGDLERTLRFLDESRRQQERKTALEETILKKIEASRMREKNALLKEAEASRREQEALRREAETSGRRARQARMVSAIIAGALVVVSLLGFLTLWQWRQARGKSFEAKYNLGKVFEEKAATALGLAEDGQESIENYQKAWLYSLAALKLDTGDRQLPVSQGRVLRAEIFSEVFRLSWQSPLQPGSVLSVAFSPDGTRLASGSIDNTIRVWGLEKGETLTTLQGHSGSVLSVAFNPGGTLLASSSVDNTIRVWDLEKGETSTTFQEHSASVWSVAFSPDGTLLASGSGDNTIRVWDLEKGESSITLQGHSGDVLSVAFSPDGKRLVSGSVDNTVRVWDLEKGKSSTLQGHSGDVWSVTFSPDGTLLASGSVDNTIRVWDLEKGGTSTTLQGHSGYILSVAFNPNGTRLTSGSVDNTIRLWDLEKGETLATLQGHSGDVWSVAFSPDGKRLASGSGDYTIRLWDLEKDETSTTLQGHSGDVLSVAFSPDSTRLASGSFDDTIRVWDLEKGEFLTTLQGHSGDVLSVAFSPDGTRLASGSVDNTIRVWDLDKGETLTTLQGPWGDVLSVAFSPDGTRLAFGSGDSTIRLLDLEKGEKLNTLKGHSEFVSSVAFSPDGTRLASGSGDSTIRLWDFDKGETLTTLQGHSGVVWGVAFSPNRTHFMSGSRASHPSHVEVRFWDLRLLKYFENGSGTSVDFERIYDASFYLMGFELDGFKLVSKHHRIPRPGRFARLDRPRPPGKDPIEWILENVD